MFHENIKKLEKPNQIQNNKEHKIQHSNRILNGYAIQQILSIEVQILLVKLIFKIKNSFQYVQILIKYINLQIIQQRRSVQKILMSAQQTRHYGFYHTQTKTFFYFQNQKEFSQFMQIYKRYQAEAVKQIEEINKADLDQFNNVFEQLNSSTYQTGGELKELDF